MSEREQAIQLINEIPDYKMGYIVAYLQGAVIGTEEPNAETIEAIKELESGGGEYFDGATEDLFKIILEAENV